MFHCAKLFFSDSARLRAIRSVCTPGSAPYRLQQSVTRSAHAKDAIEPLCDRLESLSERVRAPLEVPSGGAGHGGPLRGAVIRYSAYGDARAVETVSLCRGTRVKAA